MTNDRILGITADGEPLALMLDALIGGHACLIANSGGGKSGALRKVLEVAQGQVQEIILDVEDDFYTLRERGDYVIAGGDGADIPISVATAPKLALEALTHGFSLIVQMNDLGSAAPAYVAAFVDALMNSPRELWHPLLIVVDEAQRFAPSQGSTEASESIRDIVERGRKRGFTGLFASLAISSIDARVRGLCNNWLLGRTGSALDRDTSAKQLGFTRKHALEAMKLQPRQFWAYGPAIADEPVLFRVGDVETTPVRAGQARVTTPPAPEALREILAGLAVADPAKGHSEGTDTPSSDLQMSLVRGTEFRLLRERADAMEQRALRAEDLLNGFVTSTRMFAESLDGAVQTWGFVDAHVFAATTHLEANGWTWPDDSVPADKEERDNVDRSAQRAHLEPETPAPAPRKGSNPTAGASTGSPAAIAIADLLDRVNPALLTWTQAAAMTGRKATGGNFNAARKWLRESGRIIEEGDLIRSASTAPAGMTRGEALGLWRSVLTSPAPKMIDAFLQHTGRALTKDDLGQAIGAAPRGGNFNNGLAQLRRNCLLVEQDGSMRLARPLPGEAA